MADILTQLKESPSIAKFEIVEDEHGKRTTLSMNPRYFFTRNTAFYDENSEGEGILLEMPSIEHTYLIFDVRDKSNNEVIPATKKVTANGEEYVEKIPTPVIKTGYTPVSATYNPAHESSLCPVMYNSKHNMIRMDSDIYSKIKNAGYIDYVSIMQFKDGTNYINVNYIQVGYSDKSKKLFFARDDRFSLKLRGDNGTTSLVKNGRLCMSHKSICEFFGIIAGSSLFTADRALHKEYGIIQDLFCELFFPDYNGNYEQYLDLNQKEFHIRNPKALTRLYRVKRNKQLNELPWNEYELSQLYANPNTATIGDYTVLTEDVKKEIKNTRANINRYLRKGDTKKATNACFYGFTYPKAFRRLMLKTKPMQFDKQTYDYLDQIVKSQGVNKAVSFFSKDGEPDTYTLQQTHVLKAICLGFKPNKIIRHLKSKQTRSEASRTIADALKMRDDLIDMRVDIELDERDIFKYHDLISKVHNTVMQSKKSAESELYKTVDTSNQMPRFTQDEYTVTSPDNAFELITVGNKMNHCVGSYMKEFFYRRLEICLVKKDDEYLACLEIRDNNLVQAKLSNNRSVTDDKKVLSVVQAWAKKNDIEIATVECGAKQNKSVHLAEQCEERINMIKNLNLEENPVACNDEDPDYNYEFFDELIDF